MLSSYKLPYPAVNKAILLAIVIAAITLLVLLAWKNKKDRRKFERQLNEDNGIHQKTHSDTDPEEMVH